jgi:hypothetical protein
MQGQEGEWEKQDPENPSDLQTNKKPVRRPVFVRVEGLEPTCLAASDPKSDTSANFATPALSACRQCLKPGSKRARK